MASARTMVRYRTVLARISFDRGTERNPYSYASMRYANLYYPVLEKCTCRTGGCSEDGFKWLATEETVTAISKGVCNTLAQMKARSPLTTSNFFMSTT